MFHITLFFFGITSMDKEENRSRKVIFVVCTVNSLYLFHVQTSIGASRSEPHTNPPYEKIAVPTHMYYVLEYVSEKVY